MTELFSNLALGFSVAGTMQNLLFCLAGALVGTLVGVLPGVGSLATIAMLLPLTFGLPPEGALIMLAGIYYGAQYGGSTTSILLATPGEATSVVTVLDGHQMAVKGRAGTALAIAAIGSFAAGCVATVLVAALGKPLSEVASLFGPAEYVSLIVLGVILAVVLARGSTLKAVAMVVAGLLLATVGADPELGIPRMTLDLPDLFDGISFVNVAMGVFAFATIIHNLERPQDAGLVTSTIGSLSLSRADLRRAAPAIARGTAIGSLLGILPGAGAVMASFAAYSLEKKMASRPEEFGTGRIEGLAAPESANNAAAQTSFIPMLTLGIPPNPVMALMVGAMIIHGIVPGPQIINNQPQLFWGLVVSMWLGNVMLLVINLPLVGLWVKLLKVPYRLLFPSIIVFCCIGIFSIRNSPFDLLVAAVFAVVGYWLVKHDFEPAPFVLAFVLGPMLEENLRRAMLVAGGDATVFVTRPLSAVLLAIALLLLATTVLPAIRKRREEIFTE
jgi:putative tricarboxylic transport membrane protein